MKAENVKEQPAHLNTYKAPTKGILSKVPSSFVPYLELSRIDRTNGFYGFYITHLIGLGWAASLAPLLITIPQLATVAVATAIWLVWHRGAACTVNDILDREFDRQVARCRNRPMARRAISVPSGWIWYAVQVAVSFILCMGVVPYGLQCIFHAAPMLFLVSVYPLFKRWTDFPQLVLGVPLAWAVMMSCTTLGLDPWTSQTKHEFIASLCLCGSEFIRIVVLDYVNACQDTEDDIKAGVKSMAVRYLNTAKFTSIMGSAQVFLLATAGFLVQMSPIYFIFAVGGNLAVVAWMASTADRQHPETCAWWFQNASLLFGATTITAFAAEYVFHTMTHSGIIGGP